MATALSLPERREWTVDDLTGRVNDFRYEREYARAGVPYYWVINPLRGPITLTELVLDPDRPAYQARTATSGVFETDRPWPVRLDLPALTRQSEELLAPARGVPATQ